MENEEDRQRRAEADRALAKDKTKKIIFRRNLSGASILCKAASLKSSWTIALFQEETTITAIIIMGII